MLEKKEDKFGGGFFSSLLGFKVFHPRFDWAESRRWKKLGGSRNENRKKSNTTVGAPFRRRTERKRTKGREESILKSSVSTDLQ